MNSSNCIKHPMDPVCDTEGQTHKNPCYMLVAGKELDYFGKCLTKCLKV